ncbi:hypothetical protein GC194_06360 [bacterium]|nr:hypothetical protein [bacterium]
MPLIKGNPLLSEDRLLGEAVYEDSMTVKGTVQKTAILFAIVLFTGSIAWSMMSTNPALANMLTIVGAIGGMISAMIGIFRPKSAGISAPFYAAFEGLFLGAVSFMFNQAYAGIVFQAIILTLGVLLVMLGLYSGRILKATNTFVKVVVSATIAVGAFYFIAMIASFFGSDSLMAFTYGSSWFSIGFTLFVVVLAALNFVIDFDMVEKGEEHGAPRFMEWYGAMSIMITLIWLYVNILRLLAQLANRD